MNQPQVLGNYYKEISDIFFAGDGFKKMISMMRVASNDEDALTIYNEFHKVRYAARWGFYSLEEKIAAIKITIGGLDYFGIAYPPIPDTIKELFV